MGNTYSTIFLNQKDPSDINKAAAVCLLDADEKHYFSRLPVGQGIVKLQDRWTRPVHVQFPLVAVRKGAVTDAMLARYSAVKRAQSTGSGRKTSVPTYFGQVRRVRLYDIPLNDDALHLLPVIDAFFIAAALAPGYIDFSIDKHQTALTFFTFDHILKSPLYPHSCAKTHPP